MGSSYIAAISSEPVVVIVDDQSILAVWLEEFFLESGLAVCRVEPNALEITLEDLDYKNHQIYKILFLHGFSSQSSWLNDIVHQNNTLLQQHILTLESLNILSKRSESIIAIVHRSSLDLSEFSSPILVGFQQINNFEKDVVNKLTQFNKAQIFIGIDTADYSENMELPLLYSFLGVSQGVLFDPECPVYLQPIDAVYLAVVAQLLKPHISQVVTIHGKKKLASFWLDKIKRSYYQYFRENLSILSVTAQSSPLALIAESISCQTQTSCEEMLDSKVRSLPSFLKEIQKINTELIQAEKDPINLSVKDLATYSQGESRINSSHLPTKWHKNTGKSTYKEDVESEKTDTKTTPENHHYVNNILMNQEKDDIEPGKMQEDLVIETWDESISATQILKEQKKADEPIEIKEKGVVYLDQELQKIFLTSRTSQKKQRITQKVKATKKIIFKSKKHKAMFLGGLALVGAGCVTALLIGLYQLSVFQSRKAVFLSLAEAANSQQLVDGQNNWTSLLETQVTEYSKIVKEEMVEGGKVLAELASVIGEIVEINQKINKTSAQWLDGIQGGAEYDINSVSQGMVELLGSSHEKLSSLLGFFERIDIADLTQSQQDILSGSTDNINKNIDNSAIIARFLQATPEILGMKEKKTYAVLIQNDLELRPTGGFLQNVLLLTWNRGVLVDSKVYNTYEIDNKLTSAVKPPDEIKKTLGEQKWYLRDSNWNPDFPTTAKQVNWFVEESLGRSVDGVIALNYSSIQELLKITGPISLDEFNEEITDKNIYDKLEFHAEGKVENKAGKKVEYTALVLTKILDQIKKLEAEKATQFFEVFYRGLQRKEIAFSSFNTDDAQLLKELGWDGSLITPKCPSQFLENTCVLDSLYQVDANVGINKVNGYVEKKVEDKIAINEKNVIHQRVVTYINNAKLDLWPQGTYRAYLKFYIPATSKLLSISLNSIPISSEALTIYTENGQRILGASVDVAKQKNMVVRLEYQLDHAFEKPFSYFFFNQRQSGDRASKEVIVTLDKKLKARVVAPKADIDGNVLRFQIPEFGDEAVGLTLE